MYTLVYLLSKVVTQFMTLSPNRCLYFFKSDCEGGHIDVCPGWQTPSWCHWFHSITQLLKRWNCTAEWLVHKL